MPLPAAAAPGGDGGHHQQDLRRGLRPQLRRPAAAQEGDQPGGGRAQRVHSGGGVPRKRHPAGGCEQGRGGGGHPPRAARPVRLQGEQKQCSVLVGGCVARLLDPGFVVLLCSEAPFAEGMLVRDLLLERSMSAPVDPLFLCSFFNDLP
jgi:hypothetical protein